MANPIVQQINAELEQLQTELKQFKSTVEYLSMAKMHVSTAVETINHAENHFNEKVQELRDTYDAFLKLTDTVERITSKIDSIDFPVRLDNIEVSVMETIEQLDKIKESTIDELKKASAVITKADFEGRFKKLQNAVDISVRSNERLGKSVEKQKLPEKIDDFRQSINEKLRTSLTQVQKNSEKAVKDSAQVIIDLNLPIRFDKLDTNISGILLAVQNLQTRIDSVERNIGDKLKDLRKKQDERFKKLEDALNSSISLVRQQNEENAKKQKKLYLITWGILLAISIVGLLAATML